MSVFPRNTLFLFEIFEILWYNIYTKMRGEKKMIDAKFVHKAIDGVVGRFKKSQLHIARHFCEVVYNQFVFLCILTQKSSCSPNTSVLY